MVTTFAARKKKLVVAAAVNADDRERFLKLAREGGGDVVETPSRVHMAVWAPPDGEKACRFAAQFAAGRAWRVGLAYGLCVIRMEGERKVAVFGDIANIALRIGGNDALPAGKAYADQAVVTLCEALTFKRVDGVDTPSFGEQRGIFELA